MLSRLINRFLCVLTLHKWMLTEDDLHRTCEYCGRAESWEGIPNDLDGEMLASWRKDE